MVWRLRVRSLSKLEIVALFKLKWLPITWFHRGKFLRSTLYVLIGRKFHRGSFLSFLLSVTSSCSTNNPPAYSLGTYSFFFDLLFSSRLWISVRTCSLTSTRGPSPTSLSYRAWICPTTLLRRSPRSSWRRWRRWPRSTWPATGRSRPWVTPTPSEGCPTWDTSSSTPVPSWTWLVLPWSTSAPTCSLSTSLTTPSWP